MTYKELYLQCLENGCTPVLAEMLASRSFPGTKGTDRAYMQGRQLGGAQFEGIPLVGRHHLKIAHDAGVSVTGKWYAGTLARPGFPGDPEAWVSSLDDLRAIVKRRGWTCTGAVEIKEPRYLDVEPQAYHVADDLVEQYVEDAIAEDPALEMKRADVKEAIAVKLAGRYGTS